MWGGMLKIMNWKMLSGVRHEAITPEAVLDFMIFDRENPGSIFRLPARHPRERPCRPWHPDFRVVGNLQRNLLKMRDFTLSAKMMESGPGAFFEWVKYRSHLSRGVTIGTMLQDESLRFIRLEPSWSVPTTPRASLK